MRSLSTSVTAILPVGSLLFFGATISRAPRRCKDLALALFVGMAVGAYSSIIVATPLLVWLKEKEPRWASSRSVWNSRALPARGTGAATAAAAPHPAAPKPTPGSGQEEPRKRRRRHPETMRIEMDTAVLRRRSATSPTSPSPA